MNIILFWRLRVWHVLYWLSVAGVYYYVWPAFIPRTLSPQASLQQRHDFGTRGRPDYRPAYQRSPVEVRSWPRPP